MLLCMYLPSQGQLYIIEGLLPGGISAGILAFNVENGLYKRVAQMNIMRLLYSLAVSQTSIFTLGGILHGGEPTPTCEWYNPQTDR